MSRLGREQLSLDRRFSWLWHRASLLVWRPGGSPIGDSTMLSWDCSPSALLAASFITLGTVGLLDSFRRFAVQGLGTPAPVFPTRHLVVTGLYRYVRNPMYVGVVSAILGQALIFGNVGLLEYGGLVWLLFHLFVLVYEEPTLKASFGAEYEVFCAEVPRWIPRLTPWNGHLNGLPVARK